MRLRRITAWLAPLAAGALALVLGGSARADVCVIVNPVIEIGCRAEQGAPAGGEPKASSEPAGVPEPEPARRTSSEPRYDPRRLAITFEPGTAGAKVRAAISEAGATLEEAIPKLNAYLVGIEPEHRAEALRSLRASPLVASASQSLIAEIFDSNPDDADWPLQEGLRVAGFPKAWDVTRGSSRVVVAVVDTGVDANQPDLRGAVLPGYDFINSDSDPSDDHGHGTAVAGVIAARADNRLGGAGVCSRCSILPIKVLDADGNGNDARIAAGIVWAVDHGAKVINLSLGGPGSSTELTNAIAYATGKGVIVVAAAGNAGSTRQYFPAGDRRAISVAATTFGDRRYSWSNFGSWVRVAAPGCNVAPVLGNGYADFCGTSSASPLVAGLVGLELSAEPSATAQEVEQALIRAAAPLPDVVQYGRIDAGRTLSLLRPAAVTRASAVFRGTTGSKARTYRLEVGEGTLTATLRFTGGKRLALSLIPAGSNKPIASVSGRSPLRLSAAPAAGGVTFRVGGVGSVRAKFVFTVSYALRAGSA
jgi:subtilisin family serine protease